MPHESLEIEHRTVVCRRCGGEFITTVTRVLGNAIVGSICEACGKAEDRLGSDDPKPDIPPALARVGINVRSHGESSLDNWEGGGSAVAAAREFVADVRESGRWERVRGLMLCGGTGVGKTHIATGIIRELLGAGVRPAQILFDRASRLITEIQDTYGTGGTSKVLERRERALVWVLDDLGAEKATSDSLRIVHDLIDAREGHPNVITSNFTPPQLGERHTDMDGWARISSRLGSKNYRIIRVGGSDRRFIPPAA